MSFLIYDLSFLVIFSIAIGIFLYVKRKNLIKDGIMYLYKTRIGLEIIEYLGKRNKKLMKFFSYIIVVTGYLLMALSLYLMVQIVWIFSNPEFVKIIKVPPIMPLIPYLPSLFQVTWLPPFYFTYWILALAIVAIAHEGFHGIFARFYNIKIKSTGFGFLGPFLAFFVEQDDKQMQKAKIFPQLTILGAGVFANVLCAIIFGIMMLGFMNIAYSPQGIAFNDYTYSVGSLSDLNNSTFDGQHIKIDGVNLTGVILANKTYFVFDQFLDKNYTKTLANNSELQFYWDAPAIKNSVKGAIIEINGKEIINSKNFSDEISKFNPGEKIKITTKFKEGINTTILNYDLVLGEDYTNSSKPIIGTATIVKSSGLIRTMIFGTLGLFRDPVLNYEPKFNEELVIFIYNLFLWLVLISFSVAVTNMMPLGIFDGGRFFYLSVLAVTKKQKVAEIAFKFATWFLLGLLALVMILWFIGIR